ncbi:alpha/beta fold hydrolase [Qipengyuania qiaonensis]|uniref:Alpha/beta hydrolase n=1 Tax=Qipengyuania qiaonensis TaxID=2867240 RepID=A0ABS7JBK0_9SPHN|nr:alpha/beta hydrolase [Qipengyuania qiaonensis]MBX7483345.1 alpha/beta hydrolase [Qipengyuania qiaonensis]
MSTRYKTTTVDGIDVFYREAGSQDKPVLLLLHGFPSASHMFRDLIPLLEKDFRLIAPDLVGFGQTLVPDGREFVYSFENLTRIVEGFCANLALDRFSLYVFDYGAPIGFRLAMRYPEKIEAIITQNGNAYVEGFSDEWGPWEEYWRNPTPETREACRPSLAPETIREWQYGTGARKNRLAPDGYELDIAYMARPGAEERQLDLIGDYKSNVALYPDFQNYFREEQPPLLAVWGRHDPAFIPPGADAFKRDLPNAQVHLLDAGHFALETHAREIAAIVSEFSCAGPE